MGTNPVHPGTAVDQALNIAYAAAQGQCERQRNDEWVETVRQADKQLRAMKAQTTALDRDLIPSKQEGWNQNDDGYVVWRVVEEMEDDKPVKMVEVVTNPYHNGGGWGADADIITGKKGRHEMTLGEDLILDWAKAIIESRS